MTTLDRFNFFFQYNLPKKLMNKVKDCSPKDNFQTNQHRSTRNCMRFDTLPSYEVAPNAFPSPPIPRKKETNILYQGENSQSSYLKRVKIGSFRVRNDTECWQKKKQNRDPWAPDPASVLGKVQKEQKPTGEGKGRSTKSFMIRKKNNSAYSKKQLDDVSNLQNMHKIIMQQMFEHSKELNKKVFKDQESFNFQQSQKNRAKPMSVYAVQSSYDTVPRNDLNLKAVICREPKKISRGLNQTRQSRAEQSKPSIDKKTIDSFKKISQIQNKIKMSSKQSIEQSKDSKMEPSSFDRKQEKVKSLHIKDGNEMKPKNRAYAGCKTIRVPWETSGTYFNQTKNTDKLSKGQSARLDSTVAKEDDWNFGQISVIPSESQQERKTPRKNSMAIQSLQELYIELEKGCEGKASEPQDQFFL